MNEAHRDGGPAGVRRRVFAAAIGLGMTGLAAGGASAAAAQGHRNSVLGVGGGLQHVGLWSKTFDRSVDFYCEGLGFKSAFLTGAAPHRTAFLDSGAGLFIELFENLAFEPQITDDALLPLKAWPAHLATRGPIFHFALRTNDVDGAFKHACAHGAKAVFPPMDGPLASARGEGTLSTRWSYIEGPSGEWIELIKVGAIPPKG